MLPWSERQLLLAVFLAKPVYPSYPQHPGGEPEHSRNAERGIGRDQANHVGIVRRYVRLEYLTHIKKESHR